MKKVSRLKIIYMDNSFGCKVVYVNSDGTQTDISDCISGVEININPSDITTVTLNSPMPNIETVSWKSGGLFAKDEE